MAAERDEGEDAPLQLLLFETCDGCTVPITESFIRQHMSNSVFPRLLGRPMKDGLTTPQPSADGRQRLTILVDLGIRSTPLLHLLQLLRTGRLPPDCLQEAYEVSLRLGGFAAVDRFMEHPPPPPPAPKRTTPALRPEDDVDDEFQWTVANINHAGTMEELRRENWTATVVHDVYYMVHRRKREETVEA